MRMNTSDNYESCVCFCFLTGPCLQSNLEFCAQANKMRILSLSLDGQEANSPCSVSGHRGMRSDGFLSPPPMLGISALRWCVWRAGCRRGCLSGLGFGRSSHNSLHMAGHCWCTGFPWEEARVFLWPPAMPRGLRPQAGSPTLTLWCFPSGSESSRIRWMSDSKGAPKRK